MAKKTITTLEEYNKKYRNLRHRLLKFTKKEVESFDKKHNGTMSLLKGRKWTLIDGTYYQIPKTLSFTWFRNLHAAAQIGTCVLAAGVVATAVTVPLVTMNKGFDGQVTVEEWNAAIDRLSIDNESRNVTLKSTWDISGSVMSFNVQLDKYKEKLVRVLGPTSNTQFMKKENDNYYIYNKDSEPKWQVSLDGFMFDTLGDELLPDLRKSYSEYTFNNGAYTATFEEDVGGETLISKVTVKFSSKQTLSYVKADINSETHNQVNIFEFTDYGTTTISDFPTDPII